MRYSTAISRPAITATAHISPRLVAKVDIRDPARDGSPADVVRRASWRAVLPYAAICGAHVTPVTARTIARCPAA
ncbi:MAG: hypothetical protein C3F17_12270 [Bradyrhizobiaceae bacterium]|nr:MAG: hypothetical protein C3F17_12270 [Bradyrhizobiaceae bacterium]